MIWMSVKSLGSYEPCKGTQKSLPHHHFPKIYCRLIVRSSRGTVVFQRWKATFPSLETYFSEAGKFLETSRGGLFLALLSPIRSQRSAQLPRKSELSMEETGNLHGGTGKFFGTLISFFRSFISFFRSFISRLRGKQKISTEALRISLVETRSYVFSRADALYIVIAVQ